MKMVLAFTMVLINTPRRPRRTFSTFTISQAMR